jgi:uncharacterized protein YbjT (DUF2867 family)
MKYVITGSLGNISKPLAEKLVRAGHQVTVISSQESKRAAIVQIGAKAAIGSVEDLSFLRETFAGADAVYTMVPPYFGATDWKEWIGKIGTNYADAIRSSQIRYVVNLSSYGAHLPDGCGPVSGLFRVEQALNKLADVNIKHLRVSYFFDNLLANTGLIKSLGIRGSNFGGTGYTIVLRDTGDIADAAFSELSSLQFTGHSVRYLASDERKTDDVARVIGSAIGQPNLPWVVFTNEQATEGMLQAGLPEEVTRNYVEMGAALQSGAMAEDYWKNHPRQLGETKLEDFAKKFAAIYNAN